MKVTDQGFIVAKQYDWEDIMLEKEHEMSEFLWKALRPGKRGGVDVVGFMEMTESSALAGQVVTRFIDNYATEELARKDYPDVEGFTNEWLQPQGENNVR